MCRALWLTVLTAGDESQVGGPAHGKFTSSASRLPYPTDRRGRPRDRSEGV